MQHPMLCLNVCMRAGTGAAAEHRGAAQGQIGALTFGAEIPPYKDGMLPTSPKLRYAFPTAPTWQVSQPLAMQPPLCTLPAASLAAAATIMVSAQHCLEWAAMHSCDVTCVLVYQHGQHALLC